MAGKRPRWGRIVAVELAVAFLLIAPASALAACAWAGGWYLLTPPVEIDRGARRAWFDDGAPLSEWEHEGSYDSAKDCEAVTLKKRVKIRGQWVAVASGERHSRCIAADVPRLTVDPRGPKGR